MLYYSLCKSIKRKYDIQTSSFSNQLLDLQSINGLPEYDHIFNFSVFHHWVKVFGQDEALEMMRILATKCKKKLFFETGQSNEAGTKWAEKLSFMGSDPESWVTHMLKEIGFSSVEILGEFPTGLTAVKRSLFVAEK